MPSKYRYSPMQKDDIFWEKIETSSDAWLESIRNAETYRAVADFILKHRPGKAIEMHSLVNGGYNVVWKLEYADGSCVLMRVPIKGNFQCSDEKIRYEAATMKFIAEHTQIPVPHVYAYGTAAENSTGLGPFIIMSYIPHHCNMSRVLLDPTLPIDQTPVLDPAIDEAKLASLYRQMAQILLQLYRLKLPRIGSLVEQSDGTIEVGGRPLTVNMNDIGVYTKAPATVIGPRTPCASAREWYAALADNHVAQLVFQQHDTMEEGDEEDGRDRFLARQLFRRAVHDGALEGITEEEEEEEGNQSFALFCDDLRPANVLVDEDMRVVGVIDWEFTYAAPRSLLEDPPWWLLLETPDYWPGGYSSWIEAAEPRVRTFLRVLEEEEEEKGKENIGLLSSRMRRSWERKDWLVNYAARKSWAFDTIWWKFLDERFCGPNEDQDHKVRSRTLSDEQRAVMEQFLARKAREHATAEMIEWEDDDARRNLDEILAFQDRS